MNNMNRDILDIRSSCFRTEDVVIQLRAQMQEMIAKQDEFKAKVNLCFDKLERLEAREGKDQFWLYYIG